MGDVADAMLDGTLCQVCGVFLGPDPDDDDFESWEPEGYPMSCGGCE